MPLVMAGSQDLNGLPRSTLSGNGFQAWSGSLRLFSYNVSASPMGLQKSSHMDNIHSQQSVWGTELFGGLIAAGMLSLPTSAPDG